MKKKKTHRPNNGLSFCMCMRSWPIRSQRQLPPTLQGIVTVLGYSPELAKTLLLKTSHASSCNSPFLNLFIYLFVKHLFRL